MAANEDGSYMRYCGVSAVAYYYCLGLFVVFGSRLEGLCFVEQRQIRYAVVKAMEGDV